MNPQNQMIYRRELQNTIHLKQQNRIYQKNQQLNQNQRYHKQALDNFPFGKQSIRIANYVTLQSRQNEQNNRILQEFRRKAIQNKFNKYSKSKQITRFITQSMLPGVTINPSMANNFQPELKNEQSPLIKSEFFPKPQRRQSQQITNHSTLKQCNAPRYQTYNIHQPYIPYVAYENHQHNNPQIIHRKNKKSKYEEKYYKLKINNNKKQLKTIQKIQQMLNDMNHKISKNSLYIKAAMEIDNNITKNIKSQQRISRADQYISRLDQNISTEDQNISRVDQNISKTNNKRASHYRVKTQIIDSSCQENIKKWKLNNDLLHNQTQKTVLSKPKVIYSFQSPNKIYQSNGSSEINKIREHLKLLKRNTTRLQTLKSYTPIK